MNKKKITLACAAAMCFAWANAATPAFNTAFADTTLRVDFQLNGSCMGQSTPTIAFSGLSKYSGWGGRRANLTSVIAEGNADVVVTSEKGDTLYINPFSTLFQEWLVCDDHSGPKAMQGTVLVPMPRQKAFVTVRLRDNSRRQTASASLAVDPSDILIADHTRRKPLPHTYIHRGKAPQRINVAILGEGYTKADMKKFRKRAAEAVEAILSHEPFKSKADCFDFVAVETPSPERGVSIPSKGLWYNTPFGAHFSTFYSNRYLTTSRVHSLFDALCGLPSHHIIVLANTEEYGGGGIFNFYTLTTADNKTFRPVVVHEFGHSFAGLADEYFYENETLDGTYRLDVEPWEANITTKVDFNSKWADMVSDGTASLHEGGGYLFKGIWRPADNCRMRTNAAPEFCPVCQRAILRNIEWLTATEE